jgi:hypothetical protein
MLVLLLEKFAKYAVEMGLGAMIYIYIYIYIYQVSLRLGELFKR